jgi:predicted ribosomally synthesized peptide with nif11-like leader
MTNVIPEIIAKAKAANSAEELLELAKANGITLTEEEANTYFAQLNANGAVSDDELDLVAGGGCPGGDLMFNTLPEGTWVDVINGESCDGCGGTRGIAVVGWGSNHGTNYVSIKCTKCNKVIVGRVKENEIVRL